MENHQTPKRTDDPNKLAGLAGSSIFVDCQFIQQQLNELIFESRAEAEATVTNFELNLNQEANKQELIGQPSSLHSDLLYFPVVQTNEFTGSQSILTGVHEYESVDNEPFEPPHVRGAFYGFTHTVRSELLQDEKEIHELVETGQINGVDDADIPRYNIRPQLHFQVAPTIQTDMPTFCGQLCIYAAVDNATVEFMADRQQADIDLALETLTPLLPAQAELMLLEFNNSLEEDDYNPKAIRMASQIASRFIKLAKEEDVYKYQNAFLNLIQAKLRLYDFEPFLIEAKTALTANLQGGGGKINDLYSPVTVHGLVVARQLISKEEASATNPPDQPTICIAASGLRGATNPETIFNIPLNKVTNLTPLNL